MSTDLITHLKTGTTTVCRCWRIIRADGVTLGFTDHDGVISFEGVDFAPETGMSASAIAQSTGLSIDNSEALGALRSDVISETDLIAGRYDGARVTTWQVNWQNINERMVQFEGQIGEVTRSSGAFVAELRGLAEKLNTSQGRVYHRRCSAILGDAACQVDLSSAAHCVIVTLTAITDGNSLSFAAPAEIEEGWLAAGRVTVMTGETAGLIGMIKSDVLQDGLRTIVLWEAISGALAVGDQIKVEVGCSKAASMCKERFANFANFRGFPHIPGDDWMMTYPVNGKLNNGGSLFQGDA